MRWKSLIICLLSACLLTSCTLLPEEETVRTAPRVRSFERPVYQTVPVERGDLVEKAKISCNYVPVQTASLPFMMDDEFIDRFMVQAGDTVKRPEVNIQKENWAQFLEIAKEYGLTAKSGRILKLSVTEDEESPFERFVKGEVERR